MIKRVLFAVIIVASTAAAAYTLQALDMIVHGTLYSYGLLFDYEWANPYWNLLRIAWILLFIIAGTALLDTMFSIKTLLRQAGERRPKPKISLASKAFEKTPIVARTTERTPLASTPSSSPSSFTTAPPPIYAAQAPVSKPVSAPPSITPSPPPTLSTDLPAAFRCGHCGKNFTQPLRMLDFNSDRPRIVNICPFCNEIANTVPQTEERDQKQNGKYQYGKNDNSPRTISR